MSINSIEVRIHLKFWTTNLICGLVTSSLIQLNTYSRYI